MKIIRFFLVAGRRVILEQLADERDAAQQRHARFGVVVFIADQAADHDDAAVLDQHVGR